MRFQSAATLTAFALASALGGCGGDGSPAAPPTSTATVEGAFGGYSSTAGAPAMFTLLIAHDGTFWHVYGPTTLGMGMMTGFVQGSGSSASSTFTSSNAIDFGATSPAGGPFSVTYVTGASITGSAHYAGMSTAFAGGVFDTTRYQYTDAASLADVAQDWPMTSMQGVATAVHIATDGSLTASDASGCSLSGKLVPSADNKNYYTATLTVGPTPCPHAGATTTGIAIRTTTLYGAHLYIATTSAARDFGVGISYAP